MEKLNLGVLFSSGKDSVLALHKAAEEHKIACLITIISENKESYMFHTPNVHFAAVQAECLGIPILKFRTKGEKEEELEDLKKAIESAVKKFKINGIVTGAVASNYQASRIKKICRALKLKCINPLWQMDQLEVLRELVKKKFEVVIVGVFAYPLTERWLGRVIDNNVIRELAALQERYQINPAGEGGEIETFVLKAPMFKKKIQILESETEFSQNAGILKIKKVKTEER